MKRIALAAVALAVLATPAFAQTKTDGEWRGNLSLGLSYSAGNTDANSLSLGADAVRATVEDKITLGATALRGESKTAGVTTKTAELFKMGGRYDRNFSDRLFGFGGLDLEHDKLQRLDLRSTLSGGVGYHVIADKETTFDVFGGLGLTREKFEPFARNFSEILLGEESSHKLSESTTFKQRLVVYPNLKDSGEYRANFDATLATAISSGWNFNVTLSNRYASNHLPGLKSSDTLLLIGVSSKFGAK
jgi:putative salt-induced outer membrane protein YdiY